MARLSGHGLGKVLGLCSVSFLLVKHSSIILILTLVSGEGSIQLFSAISSYRYNVRPSTMQLGVGSSFSKPPRLLVPFR